MTVGLTPIQIQARAQQHQRRRVAQSEAASAPIGPLAWAREQATIVHPSRGRIPFEPYPYQIEFLEAYTQPRRIVLKARQIGFSQVFALEALYTAITEPEQTILLVSRSQDLAVNLLRYCYLTYNNLKTAPELRKTNESEMGFTNGSRIKSIPANRSTGRGFAASRVYLDEFAYAEYADDIYQSVAPSLSQGGYLTIGSTPNGMGNLFHQIYIGSDNWKRLTVPWWHCPAYWTDTERQAGIDKDQAVWYCQERPKYTAQQWASEFECDFVGSGQNIFHLEHIEAAERDAAGMQPAQQGRRYLTSVDLGRRNDATVINTFDVTEKPYQRVAYDKLERVPWPVIQQAIEQRSRDYPGRLLIESNGVGDPVIENLTVPATPFLTTARSKVQALQALQLLFERGDIKAQWTSDERRALTLAAWDDDHTADEVMSLAIGASDLQHGGGWMVSFL